MCPQHSEIRLECRGHPHMLPLVINKHVKAEIKGLIVQKVVVGSEFEICLAVGGLEVAFFAVDLFGAGRGEAGVYGAVAFLARSRPCFDGVAFLDA